MPLLDFFKKSPKKKAPKPSSSDNPFASPELQKKRYEAAMEFVKLFRDKTPLLHGRLHAGTVMAAAARLAGTSLFRAINKRDVTPGSIVLSEEVNTAYPQLLNLFAYYWKQNGIDVMAKPLLTEFPEKDKPLMEPAQIQSVYQDEYHAIMKKHGLNYLEGARTGMIICSIFFDDLCIKSEAIDPYVDKIAPVDFVGANVDTTLQEWSGKSSEHAPFHVRLMLWLQENAEGYGYQQSGNSWKLRG